MACCTDCGKPPMGSGGSITSGCFCSTTDFAVPSDVGGGLVTALGGCVDAIRNINTVLGARQYEVRLIWTKWSGGMRGAGEEYVYKELLLEPTPKVSDLKSVAQRNTSAGLAEEGNLTVSEISPQMDEGTLLGLVDGNPQPPDTNFFWEVRGAQVGALGELDIRRRFFPKSAPDMDETEFQWTITLVRAHGDRTPAGLPRGEPTGAIQNG